MTFPRIAACGDSALTVEFGDRIDPALNDRVLALDRLIAQRCVAGVLETVPTYRSLLVVYDPRQTDHARLTRELSALATEPVQAAFTGRRWRVPVVYGGEFGIDLDTIAARANLSGAELIARHTSVEYRVYMIGFTPGFTYLGGLDERLATPRRSEPRRTTPSGTISIGGAQTAIQCLAGPSGWHLIGRTPLRTFSPRRDPSFLLVAGDRVNFVSIDANDWDSLDRAAEAGEFVAELMP